MEDLQAKIEDLEEQVKSITESRDCYQNWYQQERDKARNLEKRLATIKNIIEI